MAQERWAEHIVCTIPSTIGGLNVIDAKSSISGMQLNP
jgi:hypothetical protein